jgi:hypothetical protein
MVRDKGRTGTLIHILTWQGGYLYDTGLNATNAFNFLGEPSLDLQYSMSLVYPQVCCCEGSLDLPMNCNSDYSCPKNVILYQVGDLAEENETSFNNFLDAIDASYVSIPWCLSHLSLIHELLMSS